MDRTVAVTGASGFVGRAVLNVLARRGATVIALGRAPGKQYPPGVTFRQFDPNGPASPQAFSGIEAVIHLAGESIAGQWTPEKKRRIADSRIAGTRAVVASLRDASPRPAVVVCASAVGYYGDRGDEPLTEASSPGSGFLARLCVEWEAAARECDSLGVRPVSIRTGIALGHGGALAQMLVPFRFGAGGRLGSGRQFVPWIHVDDLAALYCFAVEDPQITGAINGVAPDYATNARFAAAIGAALRRPALLPAPALALRAVLGEFATTLLGSQIVIPAAAQDRGFQWRHGLLESTVAGILRGAPEPLGIHTFSDAQHVAGRLNEVFAFFSDARNLKAITSPALRFSISRAPDAIARGSLIEYDLRLHGLPVRWKTMISEYEPMRHFADVQLRGPYRLWRHVHEFNPRDAGVDVVDRVEYALPLAPLGELAAPLVARDVRNIFAFRREALSRRFG